MSLQHHRINRFPSYAILVGALCLPLHASAQSAAIAENPTGDTYIIAEFLHQGGYTLYDFWGSTDSWQGGEIAATQIGSGPAIAVSSTGEANVVWGAFGTVEYAYGVPGSQWSIPTTIPIGTCYSPAIAVSSNGEVEVVCVSGNYNVEYAYATAPGSPWVIATKSIGAAGTLSSPPAIAVSPSGGVEVAWQGQSNTVQYAYAAAPGSTWVMPTKPISTAATPAVSPPSIAVDSSGVTEVVWESMNNTLQYAYATTPGSSWTAKQIEGPGTTFSQPSIAVSPTGVEFVAWWGMGGLPGAYGLQGAYGRNSGFSPAETIAGVSPTTTLMTALATTIDSASNVGVVLATTVSTIEGADRILAYYWPISSGWDSKELSNYIFPPIHIIPPCKAPYCE
ncbi:MAG: hypothetical protein JO189_09815 [Deltaproteobacteria bacterium]|nr:hypothetical protein [Deltaproteobacteria bacterium]